MKKFIVLCFIVMGLIVGAYAAQPQPAMPEAFRVLSLRDKKTRVLSLLETKETLDEALAHLVWFVASAQIITGEVDLVCRLFDESLTHLATYIRDFISEKKIAEAQKTLKAYMYGYDSFITKIRENEAEYVRFIRWGYGARERPGFTMQFKALQKTVDNAVESIVTTMTENLMRRVAALETGNETLKRENYTLTIQLREKGITPVKRGAAHEVSSRPLVADHSGSPGPHEAPIATHTLDPGPRVVVLSRSPVQPKKDVESEAFPVLETSTVPVLGAQTTPTRVLTPTPDYRAHYQDLETILQALKGLNEPLRVLFSELGVEREVLPAAHPAHVSISKLDALKAAVTLFRDNLARISTSLVQLKGRRGPATGGPRTKLKTSEKKK